MTAHDPARFLGGLNSRLATRSRHVCLLLGAGASKACGLPDLTELQAKVLNKLPTADAKTFGVQLDGRNLESALSRVRKIKSLLSGAQELDGLTSLSAASLDKAVCAAIVECLSSSPVSTEPMRNLAQWLRRSDYLRAVEVFTVNYDLLLEQALDDGSVLFFDGFSGSLAARFQTALVEADYLQGADAIPPYFARLWKLHGSVNWRLGDDGTIVRVGSPVDSASVAAIYPSDLKYDESRRVPFVVLQDRFRRALLQPETILLVSGYSFSDDHLDELIDDAVLRKERSEVVVFWYGDLPGRMVERAMRSPNLQLIGKARAVIGGEDGTWKAPDGVSSSFFTDTELLLSDFVHLARYLARSVGFSESVGPAVSPSPASASGASLA